VYHDINIKIGITRNGQTAVVAHSDLTRLFTNLV